MKKHLLTALLLCSLSGCGDGGQTDPTAPADQGMAPSTSATQKADAGPDMAVLVGQVATIVGKLTPASVEACWLIQQKPVGSQAHLTGVESTNNRTSLITPDLPGTYIISLGCLHREELHYYDEMVLTVTGIQTPPQNPPPQEPPPPTMTTLHFEMGSANGTVSGNFTLPVNAAPTNENRGGLQNKIYTPVSWLFQVHAPVFGEDKVFDASAGQTAEWCVGTCTFLSPPQVRMDIKDGKGGVITFSYFLTGTVTDLPTLQQIGAFEQGILRQDTGFIVFDEAPSLKEVP